MDLRGLEEDGNGGSGKQRASGKMQMLVEMEGGEKYEVVSQNRTSVNCRLGITSCLPKNKSGASQPSAIATTKIASPPIPDLAYLSRAIPSPTPLCVALCHASLIPFVSPPPFLDPCAANHPRNHPHTPHRHRFHPHLLLLSIIRITTHILFPPTIVFLWRSTRSSDRLFSHIH